MCFSLSTVNYFKTFFLVVLKVVFLINNLRRKIYWPTLQSWHIVCYLVNKYFKILSGKDMGELHNFNKENLISKNKIPNNAKVVSADIMDYRAKIPGEKIIKNCASTGEFFVSDNNIFNNFDIEPTPDHQPLYGNYKDPWIQMKCIPDGKIVNHNSVFTSDGHMLFGLQYHYPTPIIDPEKMAPLEVDYYIRTSSTPIFELPVARETESFNSAFFLGGTDNFGHWLFEFLPKLLWYKKYLLEANVNIPVIVGDEVPDRWLEVVDPLGIPKDKIIKVQRGKTINVKNLYICGPSVAKSGDTPSKFTKEPIKFNLIRLDDIFELRVLFRNYYKLHLLPMNTDVLFESRELARWRKITNEDHLLNRLKNELNLKIEKFFPETLSFREQLEKIQSSKCFIGTGASLPISFFMSKESVLCEVRSPEGNGMATNLITQIARVAYCRPKTKKSENNSGPTDIDHDLEIVEDDFMFKMEHLKNQVFRQT